MGVPGACSAVPHSPVSGNVSSTRGLPLAGPDIPASGLYRRSHDFDATLPVATPHGRAGTLLTVLPGVRSRNRSPCFLPPPAPGAPHTWPGPEVLFADPASSCWGSPPCSLVASPGSSSGLGARARHTPASSLGTPPSGTGPVS